MSCHSVRDFVVDETAPRPAAFEAHLAECAACRAFKEAHLAALALRGAQLPSRRAALEPLRRRAGIAGGLALATSALLGLLWLQAPPPSPEAPLPVAELTPLVEASENPVDDWQALQALARSTQAPLHARPVTRDVTYASFGHLPVWLAPRTTQPLRSLGRAVSPLVRRSED